MCPCKEATVSRHVSQLNNSSTVIMTNKNERKGKYLLCMPEMHQSSFRIFNKLLLT